MERSRARRRSGGERPPPLPAGLLLHLLGHLAALLGAVGRRHLEDALALAPVLSRARVLGGGAGALPLAGVDARTVHHVAARLLLVGACRERACHDQARRRARDQHSLVHSHALLLGGSCGVPFGLPLSRERATSTVPTPPHGRPDLPGAAPRSNTAASASLPAFRVSLCAGAASSDRRVPPLIIQRPGRAQRMPPPPDPAPSRSGQSLSSVDG